MSKKKYLKPQISIIVFEPQAILAGSGNGPTPSSFTPEDNITDGDDTKGDDSVWEE